MSTHVLLRGLALGTLLVVTATACGGDERRPRRVRRRREVRTAAPQGLPQGDDPVDLDPADFTDRHRQPLLADEARARGGRTARSTRRATWWRWWSRHDTETKKIANGITARVVRDTVTENGDIIEDTFDWYAQDGAGNVWYLGEDTAEFEDGQDHDARRVVRGRRRRRAAGHHHARRPAAGLAYRQEYYAGEAEDNGEVLSTDELAEVPAGLFRDALLTKDTITIEPDVLEYKLYARDVGPVLVLGVSGGGGREELVSVDQAPPSAGTGPLGSPNP